MKNWINNDRFYSGFDYNRKNSNQITRQFQQIIVLFVLFVYNRTGTIINRELHKTG